MTAASAFALAFTSLVTTPYQIVQLFASWLRRYLRQGPCQSRWPGKPWQSISGIMVYPITTAFLTEVVRDLIVTDGHAKSATETQDILEKNSGSESLAVPDNQPLASEDAI